jgi:small subunit ribosomal protein S9
MSKPLVQTTGRRKEAVARVNIRAGTGVIRVNRRPLDNYFPTATHRMVVTEPLRLTSTDEVYDVDATIDGGGVTGQAGALRMALARALAELDGELRPSLKKAGMLTRDARAKESKKYGLKKARKAPQYSKR